MVACGRTQPRGLRPLRAGRTLDASLLEPDADVEHGLGPEVSITYRNRDGTDAVNVTQRVARWDDPRSMGWGRGSAPWEDVSRAGERIMIRRRSASWPQPQ